MNIAFLHYHLKTGGVTTVIKQQIQALGQACDTLVLAGEVPEKGFPAEVIHIPGIAYDTKKGSDVSPEAVARSIKNALYSKWKNGPDILHVHNPTLAKNKNLLAILKILQSMGICLFLQIHDFAEDGRPEAYFKDAYVENCHYGVINARDYNILASAGLDEQGLHLVPNTITPMKTIPGKISKADTIVYPVRAIRRKNIGEAILLSLFSSPDHAVLITQPPNSPKDIRPYKDWKQFVVLKQFTVEFEAGVNRSFETLIGKSAYVITTSINEGFGFSFLEPWTAGKMLWGRRLPDICADFIKNRIALDHLYDAINIPLQWIGKNRFYMKWRDCFLKTCNNYGYDPDSAGVDKAFEKITRSGCIDFGILDESFQKIILMRLADSVTAREKLLVLNPFLKGPYKGNDDGLISTNKKAVLGTYNESAYKTRLLQVYETSASLRIHHGIDKKRLLEAFLNPLTFNLLKFSDYEPFQTG